MTGDIERSEAHERAGEAREPQKILYENAARFLGEAAEISAPMSMTVNCLA